MPSVGSDPGRASPTVAPGSLAGSPPSARLGAVLAAVALAVAVVAVGLRFVPLGSGGPAGPAGAQGPAPPVTYWAVVTAGGALSRGSGVNTTSQTGVGQYQVLIDVILYGCTYSATLGSTDTSVPPAGAATVAPIPGSLSGLRVATYDASGAPTNASFHLVVACPGGLFAVVAVNGSFVRGAGVVATVSVEAGAYSVLFDRTVTGCAYLAGLGENTSGSAPPGFVTVAQRGGEPDAVWVSTYDAAGDVASEPFHLSVYC
jgi:hypothetical protein